MSVVPQSGGSVSPGGAGGTGSLYDVMDLILDRGLVIDVFVRVSLVGIEILKVDARIVVASVDTYLRFAEACNRLDLETGRKQPAQLTDLVGEITEGGARSKSKGVLSGAVEAVKDSLPGDDAEGREDEAEAGTDDREDAEYEEERGTRRRRTAGRAHRRERA